MVGSSGHYHTSHKILIHPPRTVSFALKAKLKAELRRMTKLGIIQPIKDPADWVSSRVTVIKPNEKLRLCLDLKDLNKAIKREHYKLPTTEEIYAKMQNPKFFTKFDASNGYWQIKVDKESSRLLTFNTPYG